MSTQKNKILRGHMFYDLTIIGRYMREHVLSKSLGIALKRMHYIEF